MRLAAKKKITPSAIIISLYVEMTNTSYCLLNTNKLEVKYSKPLRDWLTEETINHKKDNVQSINQDGISNTNQLNQHWLLEAPTIKTVKNHETARSDMWVVH